MFEITVNGKTEQFATAQEMEEWRQRMMPHAPTRARTRKAPRKKKGRSLRDLINETRETSM